MKYIFNILVLISIAFIMVSCGKISKPIPIENSGYPHNYPNR